MHLGKEIHRRRDAFGDINVFESGDTRILCFGNQVEQSAMSLSEPAKLLYNYTRSMMLGCLFPRRIRHALVLGLGGGSLARSLHRALPHCRITAVEQRAAVAEVARDWFGLPDDHRLGLHVGDAGDYLSSPGPAADLIFADLYHAEGMDDQQTSPSFLSRCRQRLGGDGVAVFNLWSGRYFRDQEIQRALDDTFDQRILRLNATGRNRIVFAFAGELPRLDRTSFADRAQQLGLGLGFPLVSEAHRLWELNRDKL